MVVHLRPSVAGYAFDYAQFDDLRSKVDSGQLDPKANRLEQPPTPLNRPPTDLRASGLDDAERERLRQRGQQALQAGQVAVLILNGGMATRFGGGAKGIVPVVEGHDSISFLAIKLAELTNRSHDVKQPIPAIVMNSFATEGPSVQHLGMIDWSGVDPAARFTFSQSIMPRVLPDGTPLAELDVAASQPDTALYSAPGHGDTIGRFRSSGVLNRLAERGVEHVLVSNVDNVGASLDPVVLGAHLDGFDRGCGISVEVVRRAEGDAGGCVARLPGSETPAIIEGFRLPEGTDLADYPHFNTNTLWLALSAIDQELPLTWFAVRKTIAWPESDPRTKAGKLEVVQFERLIGQVTEFVPSAFLEVDRDARFLPIKTREDLARAAPALEQFARRVRLIHE